MDSVPLQAHLRTDSSTPLWNKHKERGSLLIKAAICVSLVALISLVGFWLWTSSEPSPMFEFTKSVEVDLFDPLNSLVGAPTEHFSDNLLPDVKYITSWISAGWTNDVMTYINLIYLGLITDRVPILPMFTPSHIGPAAPPIAFGDVFDVPRLRQALDRPILEWRDVKDPNSAELDGLGCWNVWEATSQNHAQGPRESQFLVDLLCILDVSYTRLPDWVKLIQNYEHDSHTTFWTLARFAFPDTRNANLVTPLPSPILNVSLPPDEQLLCYDYLYYVCAQQPFEYDHDYSPAWRFVTQHMHWVPSLEALAKTYINRALGLEDDGPTPAYIAIHARHADFKNYCWGATQDVCFPSVTVTARRVQEVKDELLQTKGIDVKHVIMTSDERNASWWEEVAQQGWYAPDHSKTKELYGDWYPLLVDAVIQSGGVGFVGTDRSTMSILARRRVESWQSGVTRTLLWGSPHADDHR
ncbi:hypothetical protein F5146DRAFT_926365 [Armillaria mellea]|nr:hypothetical protein F5146DRAFT_926365 [Armillaria mellea]